MAGLSGAEPPCGVEINENHGGRPGMIVSLLGLVVSLFAYLIAYPHPDQRRFDIYIAVFAVHVLCAIAYWLMSFEEAMDAFTYYRDPYGFMRESALKSGTYFIVHVVQTVRNTLGGSFLDHFLLFQCFGMLALALLIRSFGEIAESLGMRIPWQVYATMFLPGLHFWSAGIGKDGPMLMAISLSLWASIRIFRRLPWMVVAVVIMVLIRTHIAAIAVLAAATPLVFSKQMSNKARILLTPVAVAALVYVVMRTVERFNLQLDADSFSDFVENQQQNGEHHGSGANLQELIFPLKVWSLLFRPFYVDSPGMMGIAASAENTVLLGIFAYIGYQWRLMLKLLLHVYYLAYAAIFSSVVIVALALVNYNLGLGQRQKMMAVVAVLVIFGSVFMYKRYLRSVGAAAQLPIAVEGTDQLAPAGA
ncbi:MAG TPA: hypothetical protein VGX37_08285 [Allosphingosinicella sp.]|nr:hypothetical protein [Allosphingosinicella sp.]